MAVATGLLFAAGAAISWGINSHVLHRGAQKENPFLGMVFRAIFSLPILFFLTLYFEDFSVFILYFSGSNLINTIMLVVSVLMGDVIFIYSLKKYSVSTILPIATSYPLLTSAILILFGLETLTPFIIIGTVFVVGGISLVTRYRFNSETNERGVSLEAIFLGIGVAMGWGSSVIFARNIFEQEGTGSFSLMALRTVFIGWLALMIFTANRQNREEFRDRNLADLRKSFYIFSLSGLFGWVMGATFLFLALEKAATSIVTPISASNPVVAVIIGQFLGIDKINVKQFAGILLTTMGVILIVV
ncbi:MAG: EamA family transporter [Candidatus Kariarchaeaceae archaeon]|jgi:drug/metabolite transporter (DMT)-like permease